MTDREAFDRDLRRGLQEARRAARQAMWLERAADRAERLRVAAEVAAAIRRLEALRRETGARLKTLRNHIRSQRAYSDTANLGGRTQGDRR